MTLTADGNDVCTGDSDSGGGVYYCRFCIVVVASTYWAALEASSTVGCIGYGQVVLSEG